MQRPPKLKDKAINYFHYKGGTAKSTCVFIAQLLEDNIKQLEMMGYNTFCNPELVDMYEAHNKLLNHLEKEDKETTNA